MHTRGVSKLFINALLLLLIANIIGAESSRSHTPARLLAKQTGATQFEEERYESHIDCNDHKHHLKKRSSDEDVDYEVYQGVVGRPGIDFPIYPRIPKTSFSCRSIGNGYFADMETDCQVFHICEDGRKISFLCPNGTIFQQSELTCDWWFKVNCLGSQGYYADSAEILNKQRVQRVRPSIPVQGFNIVGGATSIGLNIRPKLTSSAPRSRHSNKSDRRMDSIEEQPSLESVDFEDISSEKHLKGQQKKLISNIENNSNDNESQITAETASFVANKRRNNFNYEKPEAEVEQKSNSESRKHGKTGSKHGFNDRGSQRHSNSKHRNEPYTQRTRSGHRGQQRFQEDRKPPVESYESEEQSRQQALPEKIIQTSLLPPAVVSPKFNNRVDITSETDVVSKGGELQAIESSSRTQDTQSTTSSFSGGTYSTARRFDSTRTTPFYTPTVPTVVKSKTTEGKSFYIKGSLSSTTPNSNRFNAGLASSLVLESSSGPKSTTASKAATIATTEQLDSTPSFSSTLHPPFIIGMRHHQKNTPSEIHRISVAANSHFKADLPLNKADLSSDSSELPQTTTAAPSTGPTYLPKSASVPSTNDDDASGDLLLFAPSVIKDETVTRNVNEMLKTMNLLKETIGTNKLYDVEELKFQGKVREGLEIPPSSGPDALVSLAKYFAGEQNDSNKNALSVVGDSEKSRKLGSVSTASANGLNGSNGSRALNGENESNGLNQARGSKGASGTNRTSESNGFNGSKGSSGANGSSGARGTNGASESNSFSGSNGLNAASGSSNLNGSSESSGLNGVNGLSGSSGMRASTTASKAAVSTASISTAASPVVGVKTVGIKGSLLSENTVNQYSNLFGLKPIKGKQQSPTPSEVQSVKEKTTATIKPQSNNFGTSSFPQLASTDATIRNLAEKPESRKIAQVFSNALTTYLEDPKSFREQLASARPTEPPARSLSQFAESTNTEKTPTNLATATTHRSTKQTPELKTTTPATRNLAVEINKKFEHSTQAPEFTPSTTEVYYFTTLRPLDDSSEQNLKLELSAELYPPSPDSGEGEEFLQREQTQSFVNSRNHLQNAKNELEKKTKDNASNTGYTTSPTSTPTENPWSHISQNDFLDPLTINDGLMKEQHTTTTSPFTYLPKETTTEVITTASVDIGRHELLSDYTQRLHHGSEAQTSGRSGQLQHTLESESWHDIFNNYDLPRETLPSSSGLQRIANKLFGGLNESEALHLKNVMQQAEHNRQVLSLLLLLIQTCDDQNGKALERSRKHLLNALIDMDGKFPENKTSHHKAETKKTKTKISTTTSRVPVTTYRRGSEDIITSTLPYPSTTTEWPSTTVGSSTVTPGSVEETTKFEIRVEDFEDDFAGLYTTAATYEGHTSSNSDKRALELLKSLYSLASKFTSRR